MRSVLATASIPRRSFVALLLALAPLGCVSDELKQVSAARDAYDRCVVEHSEADPKCVALEDRMHAKQSQYRDESLREWGCNPAEEVCQLRR